MTGDFCWSWVLQTGHWSPGARDEGPRHSSAHFHCSLFRVGSLLFEQDGAALAAPGPRCFNCCCSVRELRFWLDRTSVTRNSPREDRQGVLFCVCASTTTVELTMIFAPTSLTLRKRRQKSDARKLNSCGAAGFSNLNNSSRHGRFTTR